jgi:hypothetical protein
VIATRSVKANARICADDGMVLTTPHRQPGCKGNIVIAHGGTPGGGSNSDPDPKNTIGKGANRAYADPTNLVRRSATLCD